MTAVGARATVEAMTGAARKKASTGPQPWRGPIKIQVNRSIRGATYGLDGGSRRAIHACFPEAEVAPSVYVATRTDQDFERIHSKMWKQIALVLTGLSEPTLQELGVVLYDPFTDTELARVF